MTNCGSEFVQHFLKQVKPGFTNYQPPCPSILGPEVKEKEARKGEGRCEGSLYMTGPKE